MYLKIVKVIVGNMIKGYSKVKRVLSKILLEPKKVKSHKKLNN